MWRNPPFFTWWIGCRVTLRENLILQFSKLSPILEVGTSTSTCAHLFFRHVFLFPHLVEVAAFCGAEVFGTTFKTLVVGGDELNLPGVLTDNEFCLIAVTGAHTTGGMKALVFAFDVNGTVVVDLASIDNGKNAIVATTRGHVNPAFSLSPAVCRVFARVEPVATDGVLHNSFHLNEIFRLVIAALVIVTVMFACRFGCRFACRFWSSAGSWSFFGA